MRQRPYWSTRPDNSNLQDYSQLQRFRRDEDQETKGHFSLPQRNTNSHRTIDALWANLGLAQPSYVQDNYAVPQTPQTTVTVPYTTTQAATDLNVVIVGWNDTTAQVSSVTDTAGNVYQLAIGPTQVSGSISQSIFYAKNIALSLATSGSACRGQRA